MERVDFSPAALRTDLDGARSAAGYLYAAAELINHAADLSAGKLGAHPRGRAPMADLPRTSRADHRSY
jgi:hypothetical protein